MKTLQQLSQLNHVKLSNQDYYFKDFLGLLSDKGQFQNGPPNLRCKKAPVRPSLSNTFKSCELQFLPSEGIYKTEWNNLQFYLHMEYCEHVLTSQCRQIDTIKYLTVYGQKLEDIKQYLENMLTKKEEKNDEMITIYENNNGNWMTSKNKKPRKLESVIFRKEFIDSVIADVHDFIDSESWYEQMGIPYKRSYLLYGPPGTGKSSFAQALAGHIKYSICFVNCSDRVNDFQFNTLLNRAPKKSLILIQDVDSIFSERKNTEKNNALTFSGFLNAIDGVRSQEGRIVMMTTNYKQRLDPALLRPGRVDEMYEINYASRYQIERLCYRFYKDSEIAAQFANQLPENMFSMSMIQGYLLKYRKNPKGILNCVSQILESDENVTIEKYLTEVSCLQVLNDFKIEECYNLSSARNLPKEILEKMISNLSPLKKGRLLETIRMDRNLYLKSSETIRKFIQESYKEEQIQCKLFEVMKHEDIKTFYQVRDLANKISEELKPNPPNKTE